MCLRLLILPIFVALLACSLLAQPITFQKTYGGAGDQIGNYVLNVEGEGYLIAGSTAIPNAPSDGYLLRINATGDILWQVRIGGSDVDLFNVVQQASDGGFIAIGTTRSSGGGDADAWLVKVTADGSVEWERTFGGANADLGQAVHVIPGGFIISGPQLSTTIGNHGTYIIRLSNAGTTVWSTTLGAVIINLVQVEYSEGNILFASGTINFHGALVTLDASTGDVISSISFGGSNSEALYHVRPTLDSNLVLADHTWSVTGGTEFRYWVRKVTKTGTPIWSKTYGIPGFSMRGRIETVSDGGFILNPRQDNAAAATNDAYLVKLNAAGDIVWAYNYGSPSAVELLSCARETVDSGFVAVGQYQETVGGPIKILLLKTDAQGQIAGCCSRPGNFVTIDFDAPNEPASLIQSSFFNGQETNLPSQESNYVGTDYCANVQIVDSVIVSLCPNQSFTLHDSAYTAPAVIRDTIANTAGCDSILIYTLLSLPQPTLHDTLYLCAGDSLTIDSTTYTQAGLVTTTLFGDNGACDTLATYNIIVIENPTVVQNIPLCTGDSIVINGTTYTQPAIINYVLPSSGGCGDTLVTVTLQFAPQLTVTQNISFCPGDSVSINGIFYNQPTTFSATINATTGCDTLVTYVLTFAPQPTVNKTLTFCPGDSVAIDGVFYNQPTTVSGTIAAPTGCDTLATYILQFAPQPTLTKTLAFCPGDSIAIDGVFYNQPTTVSGTIAATTGCDTLATYILQFAPQPTTTKILTFCPGDSIAIDGVFYNQPTTVSGTIAATAGCDTLATYILQFAPQPTTTKILTFCPGDSIAIDGVFYNQPTTVSGTIAATAGCDTLATYILQFAPQPTTTKTLTFCSGDSIAINGVFYNQPTTVSGTIAATTGCDTLATYVLQFAPQPSITRRFSFCFGDSIMINGVTYTQPTTLLLMLPAAVGCDTLATYVLEYTTPSGPTATTVVCPTNVQVDAEPGATTALVNYNLPVASSDCPCPGVALNLQQGLASGANFPIGANTVCYTARDSCGNTASCCFQVTVAETSVCDTKVINCIKYELLTITRDNQFNKTYRIRVTNNCTARLSYLAIQQPDGLVANNPLNNAVFTAPSSRTYTVRNPHFSPFYSIRYTAVSDSIHDGESDIFKYTLPPYATPNYIHVFVRLESQVGYEAFLNTFNCPVQYDPAGSSRPGDRTAPGTNSASFDLYPNPTTGMLFADLSAWAGQSVELRVLDLQGRVLERREVAAETEAQGLEIPATLGDGLYFLEAVSKQGERHVWKFTRVH